MKDHVMVLVQPNIEEQKQEITVKEPKNLERGKSCTGWPDIYEKLCAKTYAEKTVGRTGKSVGLFIIKRLCIQALIITVLNALYQGICGKGYTKMV